jgi:hypothetical protein
VKTASLRDQAKSAKMDELPFGPEPRIPKPRISKPRIKQFCRMRQLCRLRGVVPEQGFGLFVQGSTRCGKIHFWQVLRQGMTSVVPIKPIK